MIVPIVIGAGALGLYLFNKNKGKAAAYMPPAQQALEVPAGFSPVPVAPVASVAATQPAPAFAPGPAGGVPTATYTSVPRDLFLMIASRFTFDMTEFLNANPDFYKGTDRDRAPYRPGDPGYKNIALLPSKYFPVGKTINLPPNSMDNGPREMAMGNPVGFVAPGITVEMVPNPPGVSVVQGAAIREAMAKGQKYGTAATATAARVADILRTYKR